MDNNAPLIHPVLRDMGKIEVTDRFEYIPEPYLGIKYQITEFFIDGTQNFIVKTISKRNFIKN